MITKKTLLLVLVLTLVLMAAAPMQEGTPPEQSLLDFVLGLTGIGALFGLIVDQIGKRLGLVPDGKAPLAVALLNIALMLVIGFTDFLGFGLDWLAIDGFASLVYEIAVAILGLLGMMAGAKALHETGRGTPLSNSHS